MYKDDNMKHELVSVVIPVYGVESFLNRCIDSVIGQSYKNIEIILIDDGSPDNCGTICDEYAKKDRRIKVIHKKNGGLSSARNCGIQIASGEYITFIDSDDYVSPIYIEYLYNLLATTESDISVCYPIVTSASDCSFNETIGTLSSIEYSGRESCKQLFGELHMPLVTAWGKLYKTGIVKKYLFPNGKKHEDEATTAKYFYTARKVCIGNRCLYAYYQNENSIMHTINKQVNNDAIDAFKDRAEFFQDKDKELAVFAWYQLYAYLVEDNAKNNNRCRRDMFWLLKYKKDYLRLDVIIRIYTYILFPNIFNRLALIKIARQSRN